MKVLFWGTPDFAVPALEALGAAGHTITGVVTRPSRPRGRGRRVQSSPVRQAAEAAGYPILAPERPRGGEFARELGRLGPQISVVVAYGRILPRPILDIPPLGSLNVHASLLPELRGAAPINRAIERGDSVTGVSVMRMVEAMDAGPVLARRSVAIGPAETASELSARLAELGARLLVEVLGRLEEGPVEEAEQDHAAATFAPRISRKSARVSWRDSARDVANLIRAMDAAPGAWTRWRGGAIKLFRAAVAKEGTGDEDGATGAATPAGTDGGGAAPAPGEVLTADPRRGLHIATGGGAVRIGEVQPPGKRRMSAAAWLRGHRIAPGDRFGAES